MAQNNQSLQDIIKSEIVKCAKDPIYFMKHYMYIQEPVKGKILFNLFPFQEKTLDAFQKNRFNIILKSRQLGISTLTAGYSLWLMLFHNDKQILVIATAQDTAKLLVTKVRYAYKTIPSWLKIPRTEDNALSQVFSNGSGIRAVAASDNSARGAAISLLIMDEAAFIKNSATIWGSAQSTLSTGGSAVILSTPNGVGNWFWKMWTQSIEGVSVTEESDIKFNPIFLPWQVHPDRDQKWRDLQTEILKDPRIAAQECDGSFLASGNTVVPGELLQWYKETYVTEPVEKTGPGGNYWKWTKPDYSRMYIISCDVSRGDATDFSTFHVLDVESCEQVAEFKGMIGTKEFGNFLVGVATEWNDALLVVENANIGWAVLQQIIERDYKNLYYTNEKDLLIIDDNTVFNNKLGREQKKQVPGFTMSSKTRPLIVDKIYTYFIDKSIIIHSARTIDELFVFIYNGVRAEAMSGHNDDLVLALGSGLYVRDTGLKVGEERKAMYQSLLDNIKIQKAIPAVYNPNSNMPQQDPWSMNIGKDNFNIQDTFNLKQLLR